MKGESNLTKRRKTNRGSEHRGRLLCAVAAVSGLILAGAAGSYQRMETAHVLRLAFAAEGESGWQEGSTAEYGSASGGSPEWENEPESGPGTENMTESETESESGAQSETEAESGPEGESGAQSEMEAESSPESESESQSEIEAESSPESESGAQSEIEAGSGSESESGVQSEIEAGSSPESESWAQSEIGAGSGSESESETESETESRSENEPGNEDSSEWEGEQESSSESSPESESEPESWSEGGSEIGSGTETEDEPGNEDSSEWEGEQESSSESSPESESEPESWSEDESEIENGTESETVTGNGSETGAAPGASPGERPGEQPGERPEEQSEEQPGEQLEGSAEEQPEEQPERPAEETAPESSKTEQTSTEDIKDTADTDNPETPENIGNPESGKITEHIEKNENTENAENTKSTENTKNTESTESTKNTENTENTGREAAGKKSAPEKIYRGSDYEITGDQNAWYRDANDRLWVRAGSSLYIRTAGKNGYSGGNGLENLQEDGMLTFSLKKLGENGEILKESEIRSEPYFVDGEAPAAEISLSGVPENGMVYAAQASAASVTVAPDGKSGLRTAAYAVIKCSADGTALEAPESAAWSFCENGSEIAIREEGVFRVFVRTEDQVGNLAFSRSSPVCVDRTPPEIKVEGVGDQTANSGSVRIRAAAGDAHYKKGSLKVEIVGVNGGKRPAVGKESESEAGGSVEYFDIPRQREYDDVYRMDVSAEDIAGNVSEKSITFSVNRFGSVYDLSQSTKQNLKRCFLTHAQDVVFYETNIDYVGESRIFCRRDGELRELKRGQDYQVTMQGSRDSWKQYQYTIPASYFSKEGVYELQLSSGDMADNKSDTGMQEKRVTFVLDWTAPGCTLTGIEQQVYEGERLTAYLTPYDNMELKNVRVYLDSELLLEEEAAGASDKTLEIPLEASGDWQTLQVYLCDMSGNEYWSEEMPVFLAPAVRQVPVYQKTRLSAQEKFLQQAPVSAGVLDEPGEETKTQEARGSGARAVSAGKTVLESAGRTEAEDPEPVEGQAGRTVQKDQLVSHRKKEGMLLLLLGSLTFIMTAAACACAGIRKKS